MIVSPHAKKRAAQRYGISLNRQLHKLICKEIRNGKAEIIYKSTNTRSVYRVNGIIVVYSKTTKRIITVLPSDFNIGE